MRPAGAPSWPETRRKETVDERWHGEHCLAATGARLRGGAAEESQPAHGCLFDAAGPVSVTPAIPTAWPDLW